MESKDRRITWGEIIDAVKEWPRDKKYYGVPRGGQYISAILNPVDTPEEADVIVDDLYDSGSTMERWTSLYPDKEFKVAFDKRDPELRGKWLHFPWETDSKADVQDHMARVIEYFDDISREGLQETPKRYIKFLTEFLNPPEFNYTAFDSEGMDQMIVQTDIPFYSLCEHHLAPFFGVGHIAYIPDGKIVGLSKLARTLELYARGFQNQERITTQVAERLQQELNPKGVAVVIKAQHLCMAMRGVKKHNTWTTTSCLKGYFKDDQDARNEFLNFLK